MKKGKIIGLIVFLMFMGALGFGILQIVQNPEKYQKKNSNVDVILDATSFYRDNKTVNESQLIEMNGQPDSIEEWTYNGLSATYAIRTLYYGNYSYHFNHDMLQRISIDNAEIPYENKNDILTMFGLKKYSNTKINDLNVSYRADKCGVYDFWIPVMDEDSLDEIRISYTSLFEQ
ncbi:hypothetical protein SDC9_83612 [bioreactor metagenome]|uniref:Uncharacterized protein n=1 Tax=bioreactor metagenome TaxID=1076179 RepID=A0A644Z9R6_9ZZZZ|nr:hypothetical protein [Oscillospiraceae bacterium]